MKTARNILVGAGGLLLLIAGGTAWQVTRTNREEARRSGTSLSRLEFGDGSKSTRRGDRGSTKSPFASLPAHLQALVLDLHEQKKLMEEDGAYGVAELLEARRKLPPGLEALGLQDLKLLNAYYKDPQSNADTNDGYELAYDSLFKRWGQLDPEGLHAHIAEELHRVLSTHTKPIDLSDPFIQDLGMKVSFDDIASAFAGWATIDALSAREAWNAIHATLAEHSMNFQDPSWINIQVQRGISSAWSAVSPRDSWAFLRENLLELPDGWLDGFIVGLGEGAPWQSLANEFQASPVEPLSARSPSLAAQWARHEPEAALAWILDSSAQSVQTMFEIWHGQDYDSQALSWLQNNGASLPEEVRLSALRAAVVYQWARIDELMPLLGALPPTDASWEFVLDLAHGDPTDPFSKGLETKRLRALVESLQPPEDIRAQVEEGIAQRHPLRNPLR